MRQAVSGAEVAFGKSVRGSNWSFSLASMMVGALIGAASLMPATSAMSAESLTAKTAGPAASVNPAAATAPVANAVAMPAATEPRATDPRADAPVPCKVSSEFTKLNHPLPRTVQRLIERRTLKVVAIGSSSTAGAGASSPAGSYPSQLAGELSRMFPENGIVVLNRGVNGEEAHQMLARFKSQVLDEKPDLVLWQVGTNTLLRDLPVEPVKQLIRTGVAQLKSSGADVILIDSQYAPKIIANKDSEPMIAFMDLVGKEANVGVFHRYAMMKRWVKDEGMSFKAFLSPDEVHMNDWSYACFAKVLGAAINESVTRTTTTATARAVAR